MMIEQYLKEGIEHFNKGSRKRDWGVGFKLAFVEFPVLVASIPFKKEKNSKKPFMERVFTKLLFIGIWFGAITASYSWIDRSLELHPALITLLTIGFLYCALVGIVLLVGLMLIIQPSPDRGLRRRYRKEFLNGVSYSDSEYKEAAEILRKLKPITYNKGVDKYSRKILDLLILSDAAMTTNGKVRRLGSIKAVEEDREAGPDDE